MNLGLKSIFYAKAKNLGICLIVMLLGFVCCIGFGMYQDFAVDLVIKFRRPALKDYLIFQKIRSIPEITGNGHFFIFIDQLDISVSCIRKALMTTAGEERLNGSSTCSQLCVYGKEGVSDEELAKLLNDTYPQRKAMEAVKMSGETLKPINLVLKLLCAIFIAVTAFVVSLVVFLLLKTKIIREKKNYGVYKALGFTTGQLLMQTVLSSLPVIFLGALLGVMVCDFGAGPLVGICGSFACSHSQNRHFIHPAAYIAFHIFDCEF